MKGKIQSNDYNFYSDTACKQQLVSGLFPVFRLHKAAYHSFIFKSIIILFLLTFIPVYGQEAIVFSGTVRDSLTHAPLSFVSVVFEESNTGTFTDSEGFFRVSNRHNNYNVVVSLLGYRTKQITLPGNRTTVYQEILLAPEDVMLNEIVVRPKRERYRKEDNPAVELIRKVIANKDKNNIAAQHFYRFDEYSRMLIALNDLSMAGADSSRTSGKLLNYVDTSLIDGKLYLPVSVRETMSEHYYRKVPATKKTVVKAHKVTGIDDIIRFEGMDEMLNNMFNDISIYDNTIRLLDHDFISPISTKSAVNFYRWYITDTTIVDDKEYIRLDFIPFNARDVGFSGSLYIATDSSYAVKRAILRTPKKMNINLVDELYVSVDFVLTPGGIWQPDKQQLAIDFSFLAAKAYVEKTRTFSNFTFNEPADSIYALDAPVVYLENYRRQSDAYWGEQRKTANLKPAKVDGLMKEMAQYKVLKTIFDIGQAFSMGYFSFAENPETAKIEFGTLPTLYSYNATEGHRMRLTIGSTRYFHPHFYFWGYGAYGTGDKRFKYNTELTWAFNNIHRVKDEYPQNRLMLSYVYDVNTLGQGYMLTRRDNIFMSLKPSDTDKTTYFRQLLLSYNKEFYSGFSFNLSGSSTKQEPARNVLFEKMDAQGNKYHIPDLQVTLASLLLRYAHNEKFAQQGRKRASIASNKFIIELNHNTAIKNLFGGQYAYNNTSLSFMQEQWIPPVGRFIFSVQADKFWGEAPYLFLPAPSANNTFAVQRKSYNLINPLEFIHDAQIKFDFNYHMGGWFFNRIPLVKGLKWREIIGFRGFYGELSKQNNPSGNPDLLLFPQHTHTTRNGIPYLEYNVGIENIFMFLRVDYVRRLNYLEHPDVNKQSVRFSFSFYL